jgi:chromosome transmission fidelity protein 18
MSQEHGKWKAEQSARARQARLQGGDVAFPSSNPGLDNTKVASLNPQLKVVEKEDGKKVVIKKDFFGRIIKIDEEDGKKGRSGSTGATGGRDKSRTWVSFNEGYSNAVRKPISLAEVMAGL